MLNKILQQTNSKWMDLQLYIIVMTFVCECSKSVCTHLFFVWPFLQNADILDTYICMYCWRWVYYIIITVWCIPSMISILNKENSQYSFITANMEQQQNNRETLVEMDQMFQHALLPDSTVKLMFPFILCSQLQWNLQSEQNNNHRWSITLLLVARISL